MGMKNQIKSFIIILASLIAVSCADQPKGGQQGSAAKVKEYPVIAVKTQSTRLFKDYPTKLQGHQTVEIRPKIT